MKKVLLIFIIGILIFSCSATKTGKEKSRYFDENNVEISKSEFNKSRKNRNLIRVQNDSLNTTVLTKREIRGKINNKKS